MASTEMSEGHPHWPKNAPAPSHAPMLDDDESEWEYEYSNTETETFYVTLDLSKADFTARDHKAAVPQHLGFRGGLKAERAKLYMNRRTAASNAADNSTADSEAEYEVRNRPPISKEKQQPLAQHDSPTDDGDEHQVQILELHSQNPIVSYKGRVYSGQWSQNAGTELLMTKRDDEAPLPALRHLHDDVELLAASCARINVQERELRPRHGGLNRQRNHGVSAENDSAIGAVIPPPDKTATRERVDQGNFLANFMALKKRRGETDKVTVLAKSRDRVTQHRRSGNYRRASRRARRRQPVPAAHGDRPRGPVLARGDFLGELAHGVTSATLPAAPSLETGLEPAVSTPTPNRWDDLEKGREEGDAMMQDAIREDVNAAEGGLDENTASSTVDTMDIDED
ncbi:hypothetical protein F5B20DRAFT_575771 [Whalleya microplaca]|nr:hypothetical protein F5B20DRAFT_575771 [Whalleya microplaca]